MYDSIDDVEVCYTYNADGIRTQKDVNGTVTYYTLDGSKIISQKTGNNEIFFEYDASGNVISMTYNNNTYYYVRNIMGDIIGITDANGNLLVTYTYDPYGNLIGFDYDTNEGWEVGYLNPFRFKGYYFDNETGFYYCNSRYYVPEFCRFLNADGYVSTGQGIIGFNMFAYCLNNPIIFLDKFGSSADMVPVYGPELPLHYQFKNQDGSYSLYDNHRNNPNSVFHEQILSLNADGGFNLTEGKVGFDASLTLFNGEWEFEHVDLSLLDVGKASLGIGYVDDFVGVTAQATAYAPSVTLIVFGYNVTLQLDVGSVGATAAYDSGKFTLSFALIFGGGISVSKKR
ncbi:MAG: RHS repeat-associated core domain-containing protein [Ruminococcaceae bacterium]|nr:RHS repeat-associated core domain-containing protein [Oscillospiraceae bacterium]